MRKLLLIPAALIAFAALLIAPMAMPALGKPAAPASGSTTTSCTITATGQLTAAQVAVYAAGAGFSATQTDPGTGQPVLVVAIAITEPESGANSTTVQNGGAIGAPLVGVGLWQITPGTTADLDPATNAAAAYAKWKAAGGFSPWTTYVAGDEKPYLSWAQQGVASMSSAGQCKTGGLTPGPSGSVGQVTPIPVPGALALMGSYKGFPAGQCTFYAAWEFDQEGHDVNWSGNAVDWWANAAAAGHPESQTPGVGDIVVYGSGGGYSVFGHVAIVNAVGNGTIDVTEMNYLGVGQMDQRQSSLADVLGFITG